MQKFLTILILSLLVAFGAVFGESVSGTADLLRLANEEFEAKQYTRSMEFYELLYEKGYYTERMLYRMSFMNENLKQFPEAIFYLKKIRQEYGGGLAVDEKIKQLIQMQGGGRIFSNDGWDSYFLFFKKYGLVFWILLLLLTAWLIYAIIKLKAESPYWQKLLTGGAGLVFVVLLAIMLHRSFFVPDRAVIVQETSYYRFPSYAAQSSSRALSPGETVRITDSQDIWYEVQAGSDTWWVPRRVLRRL